MNKVNEFLSSALAAYLAGSIGFVVGLGTGFIIAYLKVTT